MSQLRILASRGGHTGGAQLRPDGEFRCPLRPAISSGIGTWLSACCEVNPRTFPGQPNGQSIPALSAWLAGRDEPVVIRPLERVPLTATVHSVAARLSLR